MNSLRSLLLGFAVCLVGGLAACETTKPLATQTAVAPATNTKCPVSGDDVNPRDPTLPTVVYNGKTYTCCCPDCVKDFNAHPEKYVKPN